MSRGEKMVIGWREWVALPDLSVKEIKVKVDTGARTSALHVSQVEIKSRGRKKTVYFTVHPEQHSRLPEHSCKAPLVEMRKVRSSTGHETYRPVILVEICMGQVSWPCELTLVNRDMMGFRMLLGREAVKNRFLIDPSKSFLLGKRRKKKSVKRKSKKKAKTSASGTKTKRPLSRSKGRE